MSLVLRSLERAASLWCAGRAQAGRGWAIVILRGQLVGRLEEGV